MALGESASEIPHPGEALALPLLPALPLDQSGRAARQRRVALPHQPVYVALVSRITKLHSSLGILRLIKHYTPVENMKAKLNQM